MKAAVVRLPPEPIIRCAWRIVVKVIFFDMTSLHESSQPDIRVLAGRVKHPRKLRPAELVASIA